MANENFGRFLQKVLEDDALQGEYKAITPGDTEALMALGKRAGFEFEIEDIKQAAVSVKAETPAGELSEDDLEKVAGGCIAPAIPGLNGRPGPNLPSPFPDMRPAIPDILPKWLLDKIG